LTPVKATNATANEFGKIMVMKDWGEYTKQKKSEYLWKVY
jgi:hypothetical protein